MRRKILIAVIVVPVLLLLAAGLYLKFGDLGRFQGPVERAVGEALGRELTIDGRFDLTLLFSPRLVAEDVTLAGTGGQVLARAKRIEMALGLKSLVFGPVRVHDLRIRGVQVHLERDREGRADWRFKPADEKKDAEIQGPGIIFEKIRLDDLELAYRESSQGQHDRLTIDRLDAALDEEQMLELDVEGRLGRFPFVLSGRLTALHRLLDGQPLEHDLTGRIGRVDWVARGRIRDVATFGDPHVEVRVSGPDGAALTELFGLPSPGGGPFQLNGRATPAAEGIDLALDADLGELKAEAHGHASALVGPRDIQLEVTVSGDDLNAAGSSFGLDGLPADPFDASGKLSSNGERTTLDQVKARFGQNDLTVEGILRPSQEIVDTDLTFEIAGPDISVFSTLAGVDLPDLGYRLAGHLDRQPEHIAIEDLRGNVGELELRLNGKLDELLRFADADLDVRVSCPDLSAIGPLAGVDLPTGPFELQGHLRTEPRGFMLDGIRGRFGENTVRVDGTLGTSDRMVGTTLHVHATGPDPSWLAPLTGLQKLPATPYDVRGHVRVREDGYELSDVAGEYGDIQFELEGHLDPSMRVAGTELQVRLSGSDLSRISALGGPDGLPAVRYDFSGGVRAGDGVYQLNNVEASVEGVALKLHGRLGEFPELNGTDIELEARGPELSTLTAFFESQPFPAERFSVGGRVRVDSGTYRLTQLSGELGRNLFVVDGLVDPSPGLVGSDLDVRVSGPDSADTARIVSQFGLPRFPGLPQAEYRLEGSVRVVDSGYELRQVVARVGEAEARLDGTLGTLPDGFGSDIVLEASGPDASIIGEIGGVSLPAEPFRLRGRVDRPGPGLRFHAVRAELGDYRLEADGMLGEPPRLVGTNLDIRAAGPDLSPVSEFVDLPPYLDQPFEISAHFDGSPEQFEMRRFLARLGRTDVTGSFRLDLRAQKPDLHGEFTSERVDLLKVRGIGEDEPEREQEERPALLFSDDPLPFELLDVADADIRWTVGELIGGRGSLDNVELSVHLLNGHLELVSVAEVSGGAYSMTLGLEPVADDYRLHTRLAARQARLSLLPYGGDPSQIAPVDVDLELTGVGRSLHALARTADGRVKVVQGAGRIDNSRLTLFGTDVFSKLLGALNPFMKKEPYTQLECSVAWVEVEDGVATLGPLVMRSDKMVVLGNGEVDLDTEKLNLVWATKSRKGVGLSPSAITNSYIKLGGTLASPGITIRPLKAITATGAAVLTGGLSLFGQAIFDRVTAEKKVCQQALKRIEKTTKDRQAD